MNIKFKLEPKIIPPVPPETAEVAKKIEAAVEQKTGPKTLGELLFGKEIDINDIITD